VTSARQRLGREGEDRALARYEAHGYRLVARNWRVKSGEIDLVVERGDVVVICEVKTRSSVRYGTGFDAVDWRKRRKVRAVGAQFLSASDRHWPDVRFDVAWVSPTGVRVLEGAF